MRQLIYFSHAVHKFTEAELEELLLIAVRCNREHDISGMLLFNGDNLVQVLEGPHDAVETLMGNIRRDKRHAGITVPVDRMVERRTHPDWAMSYRAIVPRGGGMPDGFSDYLVSPHKDRAHGRPRELTEIFLEKFRDGFIPRP